MGTHNKTSKRGNKGGGQAATCKHKGMDTPPTHHTKINNGQNGQRAVDSETMQQLSQSRELLYGSSSSFVRAQTPGVSPMVNQNMPMNRRTSETQAQAQATINPPPTYIQSLPYTRMTEQAYQQQQQMYGGSYEPSTPYWVIQMLQTINGKLNSIDNELKTQTSRWQNVESTLHAQNLRMTKIEEKLKEVGDVQQNITRVQNKVTNMSEDISVIKQQMSTYDYSVQHCSDLCDDLLEDKSSKGRILDDMCEDVQKLKASYRALQNKQEVTESKLIDLQCRSMCENLIFSGIQEHPEENDAGIVYENTEKILCNFLRKDMCIKDDIPFDRVHRLGSYRREQSNPRPIIAKFERFKDKEYVKSQAPNTLKGKPYGVNEQYPKEIEGKYCTGK